MTCLTTRAVTLEVAQDLSTESMFNCLFRLFDQRNKPDINVSDKRTSLVETNYHLQKRLSNGGQKLQNSWQNDTLNGGLIYQTRHTLEVYWND